MKWARRLAVVAGALVALWLIAVIVLGFALEGRTRRGVAARLAEALQADAAIGDGELSLLNGELSLQDLTVRREDLIGKLALHVAHIECALPPLGAALLDRQCRELVVRGTQLDVSTLALFRVRRPKRPPLHVRRVVIDDAQLTLAATALAPELGRIAIHIDHAEAGDTVFKTPLSFLFALRGLHATIDLPTGSTLDITYEAGELRLAGSLIGADPIAVPVALPAADAGDDASAEIAKLVAFGRVLGERVVARRAADWFKSKLPLP